KMAEQIIKFHTTVETLIQGDLSSTQRKQTFPEIGPYADISPTFCLAVCISMLVLNDELIFSQKFSCISLKRNRKA
ncbi:unnamed protein product, partial [Rotaria sordida]